MKKHTAKECYRKARTLPKKKCQCCGLEFEPWTRRSKFCSKKCTTSIKRQAYQKHKYPGRTNNERCIKELKHIFNFDCCMIDGCDYKKTFVIHRFVEGKYGGKYEIGNMFAICPNHHAEIHSKIIDVEKISDCKLRIKQYGLVR